MPEKILGWRTIRHWVNLFNKCKIFPTYISSFNRFWLTAKCNRHWERGRSQVGCTQIYRHYHITHDPLLFSVAQGIFWLSSERLSRSTLHLTEGGEESLYSCTYSCIATVTSCIETSVRIVTGNLPVQIYLISSRSCEWGIPMRRFANFPIQISRGFGTGLFRGFSCKISEGRTTDSLGVPEGGVPESGWDALMPRLQQFCQVAHRVKTLQRVSLDFAFIFSCRPNRRNTLYNQWSGSGSAFGEFVP